MKLNKIFFGMFIIAMLCLTVLQASSAALKDDVILSWSNNDEDITGIIIVDGSGQGNNGTINGSTTGAVGKLQESFDFDGTDDIVIELVDGDVTSGLAAFSIFAWINTTSPGIDLIAAEWFSGVDTSFNIRVQSSNVFLSTRTAGGPVISSSTTNVSTGSFVLVGATYDGVNQNVYVDNVSEDTDAQTGTLGVSTDEDFCIGAFCNLGAGQQDFFDGQIDAVVVWNRSLNQSEINEVFNAGVGCEFPFECGLVVINVSTYNVTSASANNTAWRTNTSFPVPTIDDTPTVTFEVDIPSNCSIGTVNENFTDMITGDSNRKCATTDVTSHTCTLPSTDALIVGVQNIFISCVKDIENGTSTSGALSINLSNEAPSIPTNITCDGLNCNRTVFDNVILNCSGSTDFENDTINYTIQSGNDTGGGIDWNTIGSHLDGDDFDWNVTGLIGETFEFFRCNASDGFTFSDFFNISANLTISEPFFILFLDGLNESRKYEFNTTANITVNSTDNTTLFCLEFLGTNDFDNVCREGGFTFFPEITSIFKINFLNGNTSSEINSFSTFQIQLDAVSEDLLRLEFNLSGEDTGSGFPRDITMNLPGLNDSVDELVIPGIFNASKVFVDEFTYLGNDFVSTNILFAVAGSQIISFDTLPVKFNGTIPLNDNGTLIMIINGTESNPGNSLDFQEEGLFNNSLLDSSSNIFIGNSGPRIVYDDFENATITTILWDEVLDTDNGCGGTFGIVGDNYVVEAIATIPPAGLSTCFASSTQSLSSVKNQESFRGFEFNYSWAWSCTKLASTHQLDFRWWWILTDGSNSVTLTTESARKSCSSSGFQRAQRPLRLEFVESGVNNITSMIVHDDNIFIDSKDLSGLDPTKTWNLQAKSQVEQCCSAPGQGNALVTIYNGLHMIGFTASNQTLNNGTIIWEYNSTTIHNTSSNMTSAFMEWTSLARTTSTKDFVDEEDVPGGADFLITGLLSADNGTTWQEVQSNIAEIFDVPGKLLRFRFNATTSDEEFIPVVSQIRIRIIEENLQNFTIDLTNNGINEFNISELNSSTSPQTVNFTDQTISTFMFANCEDSVPCNIPIRLSADSSGLLNLISFEWNTNPNPIVFIEEFVNFSDGVDNPNWTINFTNGNLTVDDLEYNYVGSGNVTVVLSVNLINTLENLTMEMRYSKFNFSIIPIGVEDWLPLIHSLTTKNALPFGGNPFWNFVGLALTDAIDFYYKYDIIHDRVNAGGLEFEDARGDVWLSERHSLKGDNITTTNSINNTVDDELFQNQRRAETEQNLTYYFPVPGSDYTIRIYYAEIEESVE